MAYQILSEDYNLFLPSWKRSNAISKKYLRSVFSNDVFSISHEQVKSCPVKAIGSRRKLMDVFKTLVSKPLGLI